MIRQFRLYNSKDDMIDLLNNLDFFGVDPEGLGVSFDNALYGSNANFLPSGRALNAQQFTISILFGAETGESYQRYRDFVQFLNKPPYRLYYETDAGAYYRDCLLSELTKTELNEYFVLQESFVLDFTTPFYRWVNESYEPTPDTAGDGKIYIDDGGVQTAFYKHNVYSWSADGTDRFTAIYPGENLWNQTVAKAGYISNLGVGIASTPHQWYCEEYFPVTGAKFIRQVWNPNKTANAESTARTAFYDSDKNFLSVWTYFLTQDVYFSASFNVPANAKYCRVNIINGSGGVVDPDIKWKFEFDYPTIYTPAPLEDYANAYPTFLGTRFDNTELDSTNPADYSWQPYNQTKSMGDDGNKGILISQRDSEHYYTYHYFYESDYNGKNGVFTIRNDSVYIGASVGSPVEITIYGPCSNPYWEVLLGSTVDQSDGFNIEVAEGYRLVVSSVATEQRARLIAPDGTVSNVYQQQDLARSNFVTLPEGQSRLIFHNVSTVKFRYREEWVTV